MAPDSNRGSGLPPGPLGSSMAGILLLGLSERNSAESWSLASNRTRCGSYGSPVSSSITETFTPFGVGREYSWIRSGYCAGHFFVIAKEVRSLTRKSPLERIVQPRKHRGALAAISHIDVSHHRG